MSAQQPSNVMPESSDINVARMSLAAAAIAGFLSVALGAFGAHGLKSVLSADMMQVYKTAVQYHQVHAVALLAVGVWQLVRPSVVLNWAAVLLLSGILLFSGSLYAMAISGVRTLGMITPIGGLCWLVAWGAVCWAALAGKPANSPGHPSSE
jgi:uncharacterized membrane protein YgdD (TMEM256/DUF423 family)